MDPFLLAAPVVVCLVAAVWDARTGLIPNALTLPALLGGVVLAGARMGTEGLLEAGLSIALLSVPNVWLFFRGALGGGDVKLYAALAAFLGPSWAVELELLSLTLVSVWVLFFAVWEGHLWRLLRLSGAATLHLLRPARFARPVQESHGIATQVRLGPFIAVATLAVVARGLS